MIAVMAGKSQVGRMIAAPMLLGNDVFDVKRRIGSVFSLKAAIFTAIPRATTNVQTYRSVH